MKHLLDVNVLMALSLPTHQHHQAATAWFDTQSEWSTTPVTETAYLRLMSNPRVVGYEIAMAQVLAALATMRGLGGHSFLPDSSSLALATVVTARLAGPKQVTDFHLVNLVASNDMALATFDGSLARALHSDDRRHVLVLQG